MYSAVLDVKIAFGQGMTLASHEKSLNWVFPEKSTFIQVVLENVLR